METGVGVFRVFIFIFRGGFGVGRFRLGGKPWVALLLFFVFVGWIFEEVMVEEPNLKVQVRFYFNLPSLDFSQVRF